MTSLVISRRIFSFVGNCAKILARKIFGHLEMSCLRPQEGHVHFAKLVVSNFAEQFLQAL